VRCPSCGGDSIYTPTNPHRPFCSERCRLIDLGGWLSGTHAIAGDAVEGAEGSVPFADEPRDR
jgi:endogenous inhibitor of DNA gyrase (YacG/DUF329 family)